jgi:hypothetical protein
MNKIERPQPIDASVIPCFTGAATFMRLPSVASAIGLDVALVGVPFDGGTTNRAGARQRPRKLLTHRFSDYLMPTAADMPRHILTGHMESPTHLNPFGMKGAGEGATSGSVGAIAGAVADALAPFGIGVTSDGPFTPPAILRLFRGAPKTVYQEHAA